MDNQFQRPQGANNPAQHTMADRGTGTGVTDTYGADLSVGACNCANGTPRGQFMQPGPVGGGCNDGIIC